MSNVTNQAKSKGDEMFQGRQGGQGGQSGHGSHQGGSSGGQGGAAGAAQGVMDQAKDMASSAATSVRSAAENASKFVGQRAEDATHTVGSSLRSAGESVRGMAPQNEYIKGAAESVAGGLDSAGRYLEEEGLAGMAEDMTTVIKRNPIAALLIGVGVGFLLGRTMASSRSNY